MTLLFRTPNPQVFPTPSHRSERKTFAPCTANAYPVEAFRPDSSFISKFISKGKRKDERIFSALIREIDSVG